MKKIILLLLLIIPMQFFAQKELSDEEKIYGLSKFWQEVNYNFAFFHQVPELNWDSTYISYIPKVLATKTTFEYYKTLEMFCALLKDGHTNIYLPDELYTHQDIPPLYLKCFDKKAFVAFVRNDVADSIPLGSEILEIDNVSLEEFLAKKIIPYISSSTEHALWNTAVFYALMGEKNSLLKLKIKTPDNNIKNIELKRNNKTENKAASWKYAENPNRNLFDYKNLDNNIGYISLNGFSNPDIIDKFLGKKKGLLKKDAVIIDLRFNGGGSSGIAAEILKHFMTMDEFYGSRINMRIHNSTYKAYGAFSDTIICQKYNIEPETDEEYIRHFHNDAWESEDSDTIVNDVPKTERITCPLIILTGTSTASAAEDFLIYLASDSTRATIIGNKTFGSTGQPLMFPMPGGGFARVCTKRDTYQNGDDFVGVGVIPDIEVKVTPESYFDKKDIVLEKAIEELIKKIK